MNFRAYRFLLTIVAFSLPVMNAQAQAGITGPVIRIPVRLAMPEMPSSPDETIVVGLGVCDVDEDGDIDTADLSTISRARGQIVSAGDLRDSDGDGRITPNDVATCTPQCTRDNCARE